jgi:hypothetical protein
MNVFGDEEHRLNYDRAPDHNDRMYAPAVRKMRLFISGGAGPSGADGTASGLLCCCCDAKVYLQEKSSLIVDTVVQRPCKLKFLHLSICRGHYG